jgi:hypothetical protein
MCFDNIEVKGDNLSIEEQEEILKIYNEAGEQAIRIDKQTLKNMLKQKEITNEQYEQYVLKEIRSGLGCGEGVPLLNEKSTNGEIEKSYDIVKPKETQCYVYVLTNFNTTFEEDWYRVCKIQEVGLDPDIRIYRKSTAPQILRDLQRWCNNRFLYRSCHFFDYVPRTDGKTIKEIYPEIISNLSKEV